MSNLFYSATIVLIMLWSIVCFAIGIQAIGIVLLSIAAIAITVRVIQGRSVLR